MKTIKISLSIILASATMLFSCKKDEEISHTTTTKNFESSKITLDVLKANIKIEGSEVKSGTPPTPNQKVEFELENTSQQAFQSTGFEIEIDSESGLSGAYVQLKDSEGNVADEYYDVTLDNEIVFFKESRLKTKEKLASKTAEDENTQFIDVQFEEELQPGEFCYVICVYDDQGNISAPQEVCVEIEAWGGTSEIVGQWVYSHETLNGQIVDEEEGDEFSDIDCKEGGTVEVDYDNGSEDWMITFNQDGTYSESYIGEYVGLNYEKTYETCLATYFSPEEYEDLYKGYWSYNSDLGTLSVVDFSYENLLDPSENEEYENGELYFEGVDFEVKNNQMTLSDSFDGEDYTVVFTRVGS